MKGRLVRVLRPWTLCLAAIAASSAIAAAQSGTGSTISSSVPRLVKFSAALTGSDSRTGVAGITFSIYAEASGGVPIWSETQNVRLDHGKFAVLLGAATADGLPAGLFQSGDERWLGIRLEEPGAAEGPRVLLISVPYALHAANADTLGGLPLSSFVLKQGVRSSPSAERLQSHSNRTSVQAALTQPLAPINTGGSAASPGFLAEWDSSTSLVNSPLFDDGSGNIGVGTTAPGAKLDVAGPIKMTDRLAKFVLDDTSSDPDNRRWQVFANVNALNFQAVNDADTDAREFMMVQRNGINVTAVSFGGTANLGIGTFSPTSRVDAVADATTPVVHGTQLNIGLAPANFTASNLPAAGVMGEATTPGNVAAGVLGKSSSDLGMGVMGANVSTAGNATGVRGISFLSTNGTGVWGEADATSGDAVGVFGSSTSTLGTGVFGFANAASGDAVGVYGRSLSTAGTGVWGEVSNGGASAAAGVFDNRGTSGNILLGRAGAGPANVFRVDLTGRGFFNGGTTTSGADFAESVKVRGEKNSYEPGDVLVIDPTENRQITVSQHAYSKLVAGIYSTKPGVLATPHATDDERIESSEVPLAITGIVPCKVTAENGPIRIGDLLVTSSRAGYAMKGRNRSRMLGAVVGKALQPLNSGTGVIEVLVTLQ